MSRTWRVAVIPGDGVGPEVISEAQACIERLNETGVCDVDMTTLPWPATAYHREHGRMMPEDGLARLREYDALLLGALGDPGPSSDPEHYVLPDSVSLAPLLEIRKGFDQWACERPALLLPGAHQYLADPRARDVDMLVIRENSEGEYVSQGGRLQPGTACEVATQMEVFTRFGTERILRYAFDRARLRAEIRRSENRVRTFAHPDGEPREAQVCLITKRNALRYWGDLYTEVFNTLAQEYGDVATHHELVDAVCMKFVQAPWQFDVVAASNLQGDILTDLAAVLSGGLGVAPSCNLNPYDRSLPSMFEPTHGSAPDIAGQGIADPRAMLFTTARMLQWLGEEDEDALLAGDRLFAAVAADLAENEKAAPRSTTTIGTSIRERLSD